MMEVTVGRRGGSATVLSSVQIPEFQASKVHRLPYWDTQGRKSVSKSKHRECAICTEPLPDGHKKKLCSICIQQLIEDETPDLTSTLRDLVRQEVRDSIRSQKTVSKKRKEILSPASDVDSDTGGVSSDSHPSSSSEDVESSRTCLSLDRVNRLVKAVNSTMGIEETQAECSIQDIMFKGIDRKSRRVFPVVDKVKSLITREWKKPERKGSLPPAFKRRYPFEEEASSPWDKVPKLDAAVAKACKKTSLPFEDLGSLKDPLDRKAENSWRWSQRFEISKKKGVLVKVPTEEQGTGFYSPLFLVKKPDGSYRTIINLKGLNVFLLVPSFKMESVKSAIKLLFHNCFMVVLDLKDAYYHVPIHATHQRFLRVAISLAGTVEHFQYRALPFGVAVAPRVFTKIMVEVMAHLHEQNILIIPYLDDLLIVGRSEVHCKEQLGKVMAALHNLGWIINLKKSRLQPSTSQQFLGLTVDSAQQECRLPDSKVDTIHRLASRAISNPGRHVRILSDNQVTVAYVNHQGGTRSRSLMNVTNHIFQMAENHLLSLTALHIKGNLNTMADYLSRNELRQGDWSLKPAVFNQIVRLWGCPEIDLFASRGNKKLHQFCSLDPRDNPYAVDALLIPWNFNLAYAFPPLNLIPIVLRKICEDGARVLVPMVEKHVHFPTMDPPRNTGPPFPGSSLPSTSNQLAPDSVELERSLLKGKGFSQNLVNTLLKSRKASTTSIYVRVWRKFLSSSGAQIDQKPDIAQILEFLQKGLDYFSYIYLITVGHSNVIRFLPDPSEKLFPADGENVQKNVCFTLGSLSLVKTTPDRFHIWDKMMRKQMQEYLEVSWEMVKFMESDNAPVILKKSFDLQECMIDSLIQTESEMSDLLRDFLSVEEDAARTLLETEDTKQKTLYKLGKIEQELQTLCDKNASLESGIKYPSGHKGANIFRSALQIIEGTCTYNRHYSITEIQFKTDIKRSEGPARKLTNYEEKGRHESHSIWGKTFLQKELEEVKLLEDEIAEVERETQEDTTVIIPSALYLAKLFHSVTKIDWDYNCDSTLIKGSILPYDMLVLHISIRTFY
ncbi:unnamed protein product [Ranitomeya imitator]|uniref:ribonuclease H n=1 Tax=Ranitomeya imitator TaxID=111125 RepID=A0ABN9LZU3_9NEOB|nr:unnamed protein product [Ranitomeya imitator]